MSSESALRNLIDSFKMLVDQDQIEEANSLLQTITAGFQTFLESSLQTDEQVNLIKEMLLELEKIQSTLVNRQEKIKLLLLPLNQKHQVLAGGVYSGRRK